VAGTEAPACLAPLVATCKAANKLIVVVWSGPSTSPRQLLPHVALGAISFFFFLILW